MGRGDRGMTSQRQWAYAEANGKVIGGVAASL
jgi:hypothetical protein